MSGWCRLKQGSPSCNPGKPAPECSPVIQCPEDDSASCLEPLTHPKLQMLPLLQLEALNGTGQLSWTGGGNTSALSYSNFLPQEAVTAADAQVHATASSTATPALPPGFGCPDWPPVMSIMQAMGLSTGSNQSTVSPLAVNTTTNSSAMNEGAPRSSMCWIDASVAINLLVGSMLETFFYPITNLTSQGSGMSANPPYSSVNKWTVYWMPPNLPCPAPGGAGCLNRTFYFQLESWVPCDSLAGQFNVTSTYGLQVAYLNSGTVNGTNSTNSSTAYCLYDFRYAVNGWQDPRYNYNSNTFAPQGPLGTVIRPPTCSTNTTANQTGAQACQPPPMYPMSVDGLPESLFAKPLSSYDVSNVVGVLRQTPSMQNGYSQLPWCPPGVDPAARTANRMAPTLGLTMATTITLAPRTTLLLQITSLTTTSTAISRKDTSSLAPV
eukprot:GHUV01048290.1.p1 GENE.GHUV01048290.1~~GHUV01048290.1.p1  ORF type:complete len:437 (+),score=39.13 GHUV01048290.1:116-1426(+)